MFEQEIWKDIIGYEELYQISNLGNIKRKKKKIKMYSKRQGEYEKVIDEKKLKPWLNKKGYLSISLSKDGIVKKYKVHRLVACHFINNPNNYDEVNHKDENRQNNYVENLEWCTRKYNCNYGNHNKNLSNALKSNKSKQKHIIQYDLNNNFIKEFPSISEASKKLNIHTSNIINCCKGIYKQTHGFIFQYKLLCDNN